MTLIATYAVKGFPVVFGDLLLTGPNQADRAVAVPAQGEVQQFFGACGWGISGLTQKLNLVADNCVIAWAGSWLGARIAISGLKHLAESTKLSRENILAFLEADTDLRQHDASFVGLVYEGENLVQFSYKAQQFHSNSLGDGFICGTGTEVFQEFSKVFDTMETSRTSSVNAAVEAVSYSLFLGGLLLQSEYHGGAEAHTLRNMFGAGYEIAYMSNGRMQKLPDTTYLFWEARLLVQDVQLSLPKLIVKQAYSGDYLLVASAMLSEKGGSLTIVDEQRHAISPLFDSVTKPPVEALRSLSFQSRLLSHSVVVHREEGPPVIYSIVRQYGPNSEPGIKVEEREGQLVFSFHQDALLQIANGVKRFAEMKS